MTTETYVSKSPLPVPAAVAFDWHARPGAFERLTPPWEPVRVIEKSGGLEDGGRVVLEMRMGPFPIRWVAEHSDFRAGIRFKDTQLKGPFALWEHTHSFEAHGSSCILEDHIDYKLPFGSIGKFFGSSMIRNKLANMFAYRERILKSDLNPSILNNMANKNILVSGSRGLIGSALCPFLNTAGHNVMRLVRGQADASKQELLWDPAAGSIDTARLNSADAVIHLAGENIAGRWSKAKKAEILSSRIKSTRLLAESVARMTRKPQTLLCASAIGFYGERGAELLNEKSAAGSGFLAEVGQQWEAATKAASDAGIRVVNLRFGVVLTPAGGALAKMLTPFKMGVGGIIGSGKQYWSWIAIDDVVGAINHALINDSLNGPVNVVAPEAATNLEFTKTLGKVLSRPTIFPMPAFAARLALGEMADALLLSSTRVEPRRLLESGYQFRFPKLEPALRHVLGK